jgi:peptide-methionine (S)-S-oxide reductase
MLDKSTLVSPQRALPGRSVIMPVDNCHFVNGHCLQSPFPVNLQSVVFGLGCFWGAERKFWLQQGVYSTAVGYSAGFTPNPSYEEVCSGLTGHNEVVLVVFDSEHISLQSLLEIFWQSHNPTQGMRQGNDSGTQYRSGIYTANDEQLQQALSSRDHYQSRLDKNAMGTISTEIQLASAFYYAEHYHQQYLAKNPAGYCGLGGLNIDY